MTNIAELLKDVAKDTELYSPICGHCKLNSILYDDCIRVIAHEVPFRFDKYGRFYSACDTECLLFPSKDCRTWEGWKLPVVPKYKVGDRVIFNGKEHTITFMDNKFYDFDGGCTGCRIEKQDEFLSAAPKKHYDIANFKPKQWVLVRQGDGCAWRLDIFSNLKEGAVSQFECVGNSMVQCIPFDGNEKLLGTTDPCDERFINW